MNRDRLKKLLSGGPTVEVAVSHGGGHDDPGLEAADAILKAIKSGSAEQLDLALRDHYDACKDKGMDDGDQGQGDHDEYGSDEGE
ncbi:MAG TPA: hypothetical protein VLS51_00755 [Propionibacteriaceae bacterium]|nr:hypothetical protein [Propionibacteriaceae bacterium]